MSQGKNNSASPVGEVETGEFGAGKTELVRLRGGTIVIDELDKGTNLKPTTLESFIHEGGMFISRTSRKQLPCTQPSTHLRTELYFVFSVVFVATAIWLAICSSNGWWI